MDSKFMLRNRVRVLSLEKKVLVETYNVTCELGRNNILAHLLSGDDSQIKFLSVGSSTTAEVSSDTQLGNELSRVSLDATSHLSGTVLTIYATIPVGTTMNISEAGLHSGLGATNAINSGNLLAHSVFDGNIIIKSDIEAVVIEWVINLNNQIL